LRREPAVAGLFYPFDPASLEKEIERSFLGDLGPGSLPEVNKNKLEKPVGIISPHAGYMYSGQVASWGFYELAKLGTPDLFVLMGPNHTGFGARVGVWDKGEWETPLGAVSIHEEAARILLESSKHASVSYESHTREHSLEVQIPFIQYVFGNVPILPISLLDQSLSVVKDLSEALKKVLEAIPSTVVLASTDLNHYEDQQTTTNKDNLVIKMIEDMNVNGLYRVLEEYEVSMCGYGGVGVLLDMKIGEPKILKHATSGDVSGDRLEVVGYMSAIFV